MRKLSDHELERRYCEMLDEFYGLVKIAGYEYETSHALAQVDPTAFRCGFADWISAELGETLWEKNGEYFDADPEQVTEEETANETDEG